MVILTPVMRIQRSGVVEWSTPLDESTQLGDKWLRGDRCLVAARNNVEFGKEVSYDFKTKKQEIT